MGKYTIFGSDVLDKKISKDLEYIVDSVLQIPEAKNFVSILLIGGYGRGEGTCLIDESQELPFNDYDLMIVGEKMSDWLRKKIQKKLSVQAERLSQIVNLEVDIYLHSMNSLRNAEHSLMNHEMKRGHKVLWGRKDILLNMDDMINTHPPIYEGTRLLLNRGSLLLLAKSQGIVKKCDSESITELAKYLRKVHLAFGDCFLLLTGDYCVSYQEKLSLVAKIKDKIDFPEKEWVIQKYIEAVSFKNKVDPSEINVSEIQSLYRETLRLFPLYFLWYESKRLNVPLRSIADYEEHLPAKTRPQKNRFRSYLHHLMCYRQKAFYPNMKWIHMHPRDKLFPMLLHLIEIESEEKLLEQYLELWGKLN